MGDAIREQVKTYRDVDVSNTTPTNKAKVWVNTSTNDTESQDILLPQVDDANISEENTWSSKKINEELRDKLFLSSGSALVDLTDTSVFDWRLTQVTDENGNKQIQLRLFDSKGSDLLSFTEDITVVLNKSAISVGIGEYDDSSVTNGKWEVYFGKGELGNGIDLGKPTVKSIDPTKLYKICIYVYNFGDSSGICVDKSLFGHDIVKLYIGSGEPIGKLISDIPFHDFTFVPNVAIGKLSDDKYFMYPSIADGIGTYCANLVAGEDIYFNISGCSRCRIVVFDMKFNNIIRANHGDESTSPCTISNNCVKYNDTIKQGSFHYHATNTCCICVYVSPDGTGQVSKQYVVDKPNIFNLCDNNIISEFLPFNDSYMSDNTDPKKQSTTQTEFYDLFYNPYLGYHDNGNYKVTKTILGKDQSGLYDIYQYDFCPKNYKKTILLSSGLHAYETPASFGLARWIRGLMNLENETFKMIRESVRIKVIPIANPWGFNQSPKKYGNVNGVNPNRNFNTWDNKWDDFPVYSANPSDNNYNEWNVKGSTPFSESETRILRDWLYANNDAEFWIDCHTGLYCDYGENWILYQSTNPMIDKITRALNKLETRAKTKYGITDQTSCVQVDKESSIKIAFSTDDVGIPQLVIEQSHHNRIFNNSDNNIINSKIQITEYATTINAYIVSMLIN